MRRWQKFGVEPSALQRFIYTAPEKWDGFVPVWIFHQHKPKTFELLQNAYGDGNEDSPAIVMIQHVRKTSSYVDPAPDCFAQHFTLGFEPIGGISPLGVFLFNGFITADFNSTPPVFTQEFQPPQEDPNG